MWEQVKYAVDYVAGLTGLQAVYMWAMIIGFALPAINVVFSGLAGIIDLELDWDFDFLPDSGFLPLRPACILIFLLVFGGVGTALYGRVAVPVGLAVSGLAGYGCAVALNRFVILPMRRNRTTTVRQENLVGEYGKVTVRIRPGHVGEVRLITEAGVISYPAVLNKEGVEALDEGDKVLVVDIDTEKVRLIVKLVPELKIKK